MDVQYYVLRATNHNFANKEYLQNIFIIFDNMNDLINSKMESLNAICLKHSVSELYLFGSAATGKFSEKSDMDFAVLFEDSLGPIERGDAFFGLLDDLEELFKRPIDLISYRAIKNPVFRKELDQTKVPLYAA